MCPSRMERFPFVILTKLPALKSSRSHKPEREQWKSSGKGGCVGYCRDPPACPECHLNPERPAASPALPQVAPPPRRDPRCSCRPKHPGLSSRPRPVAMETHRYLLAARQKSAALPRPRAHSRARACVGRAPPGTPPPRPPERRAGHFRARLLSHAPAIQTPVRRSELGPPGLLRPAPGVFARCAIGKRERRGCHFPIIVATHDTKNLPREAVLYGTATRTRSLQLIRHCKFGVSHSAIGEPRKPLTSTPRPGHSAHAQHPRRGVWEYR